MAYLHDVDSISLLLLRMTFAFPFYIFMLFRYSGKIQSLWKQLPKRYWVGMMGTAALGYYLSSFLDFSGLKYIDASVERLILFIYPTFIAILSFVLFKDRITLSQSLALVLSYVGLFFVFGSNLSEISFSDDFWKGASFILACAMTFALALVMSQWLIPHFGATVFTSLSMSVACLFVIIHYFLVGSAQGIHELSLPVYLYAIAMAFLATVIPSYVVNFAIERIGATRAAIMASVGPISTISLAYWLLDERLQLVQIIGALFIIVGVTVVTVEMRKKKMSRARV